MAEPDARMLLEGARLAVSNAGELIGAAQTSRAVAAPYLATAAEEEIGKARLLLERCRISSQSDPSDMEGASPQAQAVTKTATLNWKAFNRVIQGDHRSKLRAYGLWETELGLEPDYCEYCDVAEPDCPACRSAPPPPGLEDGSIARELALGCLYVDWNDEGNNWRVPGGLAGFPISLRNLAASIPAYQAALDAASSCTTNEGPLDGNHHELTTCVPGREGILPHHGE